MDDWLIAGNEEKPAWCYYENDPSNGKKYGKLYNWYAVNDPRGLAPLGWYIPSVEEWYYFINLRGERVAGERMKSTNGLKEDGSASDTIDFASQLDGYCYDGKFFDMGQTGLWWSTSLNNKELSFAFSLSNGVDEVSSRSIIKNAGLSVRCHSNFTIEFLKNNFLDRKIHLLINKYEWVNTSDAKNIIKELKEALNATYERKSEVFESLFESSLRNINT